MGKNCERLTCIWSECSLFCSVLEQACVPLDQRWPLVILYLRGIKEIPVLSEAQKASLQELLFIILQNKDYSEERYEEVHRLILDIVTAPYTEKLKEIAKETSELAKDVHKMFGKHTRKMSSLAEQVDEDLARGVEPASLLAGLRGTLKDVVLQMEKDAHILMTLSHKDSLTGLANRRAFDLFLSEAAEKWTVDQTPVSLIMFDLDHFKKLNDTFGHLVGDQVLKSIAAQIQKIAISLDSEKSSVLAARYGGEEFALVLRGEVTDRAVPIADNLRKTVQKTVITLLDSNNHEVPSDLRVTVSVGIADMWPGWKGAHMTNLVDYADKALYHAKNSGRNCTAVFIPDSEQPFVVIAQG